MRMSTQQTAAIVAAIMLLLLMGFQLLLAAGLPLGAAAWGGRYRVLPTGLRWGSLASVGVLGIAAGLVLARAGLLPTGSEATAVRVGTWVFAGFLSLNTLSNLASRSKVERYVMMPASLLLAVCFFVVALL